MPIIVEILSSLDPMALAQILQNSVNSNLNLQIDTYDGAVGEYQRELPDLLLCTHTYYSSAVPKEAFAPNIVIGIQGYIKEGVIHYCRFDMLFSIFERDETTIPYVGLYTCVSFEQLINMFNLALPSYRQLFVNTKLVDNILRYVLFYQTNIPRPTVTSTNIVIENAKKYNISDGFAFGYHNIEGKLLLTGNAGRLLLESEKQRCITKHRQIIRTLNDDLDQLFKFYENSKELQKNISEKFKLNMTDETLKINSLGIFQLKHLLEENTKMYKFDYKKAKPKENVSKTQSM